VLAFLPVTKREAILSQLLTRNGHTTHTVPSETMLKAVHDIVKDMKIRYSVNVNERKHQKKTFAQVDQAIPFSREVRMRVRQRGEARNSDVGDGDGERLPRYNESKFDDLDSVSNRRYLGKRKESIGTAVAQALKDQHKRIRETLRQRSGRQSTDEYSLSQFSQTESALSEALDELNTSSRSNSKRMSERSPTNGEGKRRGSISAQSLSRVHNLTQPVSPDMVSGKLSERVRAQSVAPVGFRSYTTHHAIQAYQTITSSPPVSPSRHRASFSGIAFSGIRGTLGKAISPRNAKTPPKEGRQGRRPSFSRSTSERRLSSNDRRRSFNVGDLSKQQRRPSIGSEMKQAMQEVAQMHEAMNERRTSSPSFSDVAQERTAVEQKFST